MSSRALVAVDKVLGPERVGMFLAGASVENDNFDDTIFHDDKLILSRGDFDSLGKSSSVAGFHRRWLCHVARRDRGGARGGKHVC